MDKTCNHKNIDGSKIVKCYKIAECKICGHCSNDCPGHYLIRYTNNKLEPNQSRTIYNHNLGYT